VFIDQGQGNAKLVDKFKVNQIARIKFRRATVFVIGEGNPCTTPEKPFPCHNSNVCIPLLYLCDDNPDCDDAYDEDPAMCTAGENRKVKVIAGLINTTNKSNIT
jgi:hypothetical protein